MTEETQRQAIFVFMREMRQKYEYQFLNHQTDMNELRAIVKLYDKISFPGCIRSLYCIDIHLKNGTNRQRTVQETATRKIWQHWLSRLSVTVPCTARVCFPADQGKITKPPSLSTVR